MTPFAGPAEAPPGRPPKNPPTRRRLGRSDLVVRFFRFLATGLSFLATSLGLPRMPLPPLLHGRKSRRIARRKGFLEGLVDHRFEGSAVDVVHESTSDSGPRPSASSSRMVGGVPVVRGGSKKSAPHGAGPAGRTAGETPPGARRRRQTDRATSAPSTPDGKIRARPVNGTGPGRAGRQGDAPFFDGMLPSSQMREKPTSPTDFQEDPTSATPRTRKMMRTATSTAHSPSDDRDRRVRLADEARRRRTDGTPVS